MKIAPIFAIPVRPHVRQWLIKDLGPDPAPANQNTWLGRIVMLKLEKLPYAQLAVPRSVQPTRDTYRVQLPKALKHQSLTADSAVLLGEFLNKEFVQQMLIFLKGQITATGNEHAALRSFFRYYEINPDDYDFEAARKAWRDHKDSQLARNGQAALLASGEARYVDFLTAQVAPASVIA